MRCREHFLLPARFLCAQPEGGWLFLTLNGTVSCVAFHRLVLLGFGGRAQAYFPRLPGAGTVRHAWARASLQSKLWDQDLLLQQGLFPRRPGLTPPRFPSQAVGNRRS